MKISYNIKIKDLSKFHVNSIKNEISYKLIILALKFSISIICIFISYIKYLNNSNIFFVVIPLLISILWFVFLPILIEKRLEKLFIKSFYKYNNISRDETLILDEKGIIRQLDEEIDLIPWNKIKNMEVTYTHICIYIKISRIIVVPLDAFNDLNEKELFLQLINKYRVLN